MPRNSCGIAHLTLTNRVVNPLYGHNRSSASLAPSAARIVNRVSCTFQMAERQHVSADEQSWISLRTAGLSARINPFGAQLSSLQDASGHDLLWDGNPAVWNGRAPLLFPIVGTLAGGIYRLGSSSYLLSRHGFARGTMFTIAGTTASSATFRLTEDSTTLKVYPFRFELLVDFSLEHSTLHVATQIRNTGSEDMPASFGYHPAFRWPLPYGQPRAAHFVEFATNEP